MHHVNPLCLKSHHRLPLGWEGRKICQGIINQHEQVSQRGIPPRSIEAKVAEMMEQLQVLTNFVTSLTVPRIANDRDLCNQNERTIGESSRIKTIPLEITPIRNRQFSNLGKPLSKVFEKLKMQGE